MHGSDDSITSPHGSQSFAKNAGIRVTLKIWGNLKHETHNETNQQEVMKYSSNWIIQQLMNASSN